MSKEQKELGTLVVLEPGVELLHVVRSGKGKVRVVIYRDTRDGVYHWYELEFLEPSGEWKVVFRIGDAKLQEAIDMFTEAREFVKKNPPPPANE
jgi:hypothetical protein